ncbi:MAG TPA: hypothetical protein VFT47_20265 [Vicinamibacterales bacterium]|nr:hypothetical protein [Vicinamibacterales bacterium]
MISRRAFVLTSLAGSAGLLSGCGRESGTPPASTQSTAPPTQPKAAASLDLYFVGGTAFRKNGSSYVAVQMRGKGVVHGGHAMDHRSYLVAPLGTFGKEGTPFPAGYDMTKLHPQLTLPPESYEAVCLLGKDVTITQVNGGRDVVYKADQVADYGALAAKYRWEPKGSWTPSADGPVGSRFAFDAGELVNGTAVNQKGYAAQYRIGGGEPKKLSDVVILQVRAESIAMNGVGSTPLTVPADRPLALYVLAGPDFMHTAPTFRQISHALLLKTIYDVKETKDDEIMPTSGTDVEAEKAAVQRHPCDFGTPPPATPQRRVPPDSEYCVNYGGTP